jgi:hypothetical protein
MSDHSDVCICIFGELKSLDAAKELAIEFEDHAAPDWNKPYFSDESEGVAHILEAIEKGFILSVIRSDTGDDFGTIASVCQEHGLSFEINFTNCDVGAPYMEVWAPGFENVRTFGATDGESPTMAIEDITKLIRKDPTNALAIVEQIEQSALVGVSRRITASPDVIAQFKAYLENEAAPSLA